MDVTLGTGYDLYIIVFAKVVVIGDVLFVFQICSVWWCEMKRVVAKISTKPSQRRSQPPSC